jgi:hypothetical protein
MTPLLLDPHHPVGQLLLDLGMKPDADAGNLAGVDDLESAAGVQNADDGPLQDECRPWWRPSDGHGSGVPARWTARSRMFRMGPVLGESEFGQSYCDSCRCANRFDNGVTKSLKKPPHSGGKISEISCDARSYRTLRDGSFGVAVSQALRARLRSCCPSGTRWQTVRRAPS